MVASCRVAVIQLRCPVRCHAETSAPEAGLINTKARILITRSGYTIATSTSHQRNTSKWSEFIWLFGSWCGKCNCQQTSTPCHTQAVTIQTSQREGLPSKNCRTTFRPFEIKMAPKTHLNSSLQIKCAIVFRPWATSGYLRKRRTDTGMKQIRNVSETYHFWFVPFLIRTISHSYRFSFVPFLIRTVSDSCHFPRTQRFWPPTCLKNVAINT